jgi:hypothetical protein
MQWQRDVAVHIQKRTAGLDITNLGVRKMMAVVEHMRLNIGPV